MLQQYEAGLPAASRAQGQQIRDAWLAYGPEAAKAFDLTRQNTTNKAAALVLGQGREAAKQFDAALDTVGSAADGIRLDAAELQGIVGEIVLSKEEGTDAILQAAAGARVARIGTSLAKLPGAEPGAIEAARAAWRALSQVDLEILRLGGINSDAKAAVQVLGPVGATRTKVTDLLNVLLSKEEDVAHAAIRDNAEVASQDVV